MDVSEAIVTSRIRQTMSRHQPLWIFAVDALVWLLALATTSMLRYDFVWSRVSSVGLLIAGAVAVTWQGSFGYLIGVHDRRRRYGSFDEIRALAFTVLLTGALLTAMAFSFPSATLARSVLLLAAGFTIAGTMPVGAIWRSYREKQRRPNQAKPIVMIGAGHGSFLITQALLTDPKSGYIPVGLVDDDPYKRNRRFHGIRVEGTLNDLVAVAKRLHACRVLMAIPSAGSRLIARMVAVARGADLVFMVLPPAEIDTTTSANPIRGKRALVTGAGGSIGSELCRQLFELDPSALIMLDRNGSGLHAVQRSIDGRGLLDDRNLVLANICDRDRVFQVFRQFRPDVVFHAAALKHLTLLENHASEGWKINVVGTQNVLDAATDVGVHCFLNISTDKDANPISVLGWSKRITERLTANQAPVAERGIYVSVRFGNVLGSRGSVLTSFSKQASAGGPITVADPDVARYFMTVEEAVRLTIYAAAIGSFGEALVLDMGTPGKILDVAHRYSRLTDPPLGVVFTDLRPGEKMMEDLIADDEIDHSPIHPLISHVVIPPLALNGLATEQGRSDAACVELMRHLAESPVFADAP